jgi:hypothetical protein
LEWQQTVTLDPCGSVFAFGSTTPLQAPPAYNDPPLTGYSYQNPPNAVQIPVYYNLFTPASDPLSLAAHKTSAYTMDFADAAADSCLSGSTDGTGKKLGFTTHLVGIVGALPGAVQDTGIGFSYTTTFNGVNGGISVRNVSTPVDSGSGTGGATVSMVNNVSSYQYPKSFGVDEINGQPVSSGSPVPPTRLGNQIAVSSSGLAYSRATQTFNGFVTIKNVSGSAIDGPLQVVFDSLTTGVTLVNATNTFGGWPYVSVPANLAPGQSASVSVQFRNTTNAAINASPVVYAGSFN